MYFLWWKIKNCDRNASLWGKKRERGGKNPFKNERRFRYEYFVFYYAQVLVLNATLGHSQTPFVCIQMTVILFLCIQIYMFFYEFLPVSGFFLNTQRKEYKSKMFQAHSCEISFRIEKSVCSITVHINLVENVIALNIERVFEFVFVRQPVTQWGRTRALKYVCVYIGFPRCHSNEIRKNRRYSTQNVIIKCKVSGICYLRKCIVLRIHTHVHS